MSDLRNMRGLRPTIAAHPGELGVSLGCGYFLPGTPFRSALIVVRHIASCEREVAGAVGGSRHQSDGADDFVRLFARHDGSVACAIQNGDKANSKVHGFHDFGGLFSWVHAYD